MQLSRLATALSCLVFTGVANAAFFIEYPAAVQGTEKGLMSNRTHYEQRGEAAFRMTDAAKMPVQKRYEEEGAEIVLDMAYRVVTHYGSGESERITGFADGVPLNQALALVVPRGWQVFKHKDLDARRMVTPVSFEGDQRWTDALGVIGEHNGFQFHVDWYDRTIMVKAGRHALLGTQQNVGDISIIEEPAPLLEVDDELLAENAKTDKAQTGFWASLFGSNSSGKASGADDVTEEVAEVVAETEPPTIEPEPKPLVIIQVKPGTLHENIVRLSKEHGWRAPQWGIDGDFRVVSAYSITGESFEQAIWKLLSIHPIEAVINTNQKMIFVNRELRK